MGKSQNEYQVRAVYDPRDAGQTFGPFDSRSEAQACLLVVAGRADVRGAILETLTSEGE